MNKENQYFYPILLIFIVFITRFAFFLDYNVFLSDDDAGFALAAQDYNIEESRPHLPGYFVLVKTIAFVNIVTKDSFISMKVLVLAFSSLSALIIFKLFLFHFNEEKSFWLVILLFSNPLIWFYQCTPESYVYDLFFSSLIALLYYKRSTYFYFLPLISVMGGIRMSSAFFLIPLYFYITYVYAKEGKLSTKVLAIANLFGLIVTAFWLLPLLNSVGGFAAYLKLFDTHSPMPPIGPVKNMAGFVAYAITFLLPIFGLFIYLGIKRKFAKIKLNESIVFNLFWIVPALLFFVFGHYSKGYVYLNYASIILIFGIIYFLNVKGFRLLYIIIVIQTAFFLFYPYDSIDPNTNFRRDARSTSLVEVYWDRLNSGYLHSRSRLNHYNEVNTSFVECVNYLKYHISSPVIFDGKSSEMTINTESYKYPGLTFVTQKNFDREDEYIEQLGLSLKYKYGLADLYRKSYILCDNRMLNYYNDLTDIIFQNKKHAIVKVKAGKEEEFKDYYKNLYAK
ncbi:MAG: hypothetical protein WC121_00820 [Candidatus Kapaibacterium sp.]